MAISRLRDAFGPPPWSRDVNQNLDAIFWETAGRPPIEVTARKAFHERWIGSYLAQDPDHAFVAIDDQAPQPGIVGYLVGTLTTPHEAPRFRDLPYFLAFAHLLDAFPAHLHINLTENARGHGTGRALIDTFCRHAARLGAPGVHVVTGAGARNVAFYYGRVGFTEQGRTTVTGRDIVLLGRRLTAADR
jgi:GNAT superfamily N-acetyltransferase